MCRLGLLQPVAAEGRRRHYRSTADGFQVPLEDVPLESLEAILGAQMDPDYERLKAALQQPGERSGPRVLLWVAAVADSG